MKKQVWMRCSSQWLISLIIVLSVAGVAAAEKFSGLSFYNLSQNEGTTYKQGELIVRFANVQPGVQLPGGPKLIGPLRRSAIRDVISDFVVAGASVHKEFDRIVPGLAVVKLPEGVSVLNALVSFNQTANVLYAEPDYKYRLAVVPSDTRFPEQWALNNTGQTGGTPDADIDAPEAWDLPFNFNTVSRDLVVAVIDTGIDYAHPDLADNIWINPGEISHPGPVGPNDFDGADDDDNGYVDDIYGWDFGGSVENDPYDNDNDPNDSYFHGTHVAGIIGAVGNNAQGVSGVCWRVKLMALKITGDDYDPVLGPSFFIVNAIEAIEYAIDKGADVINASWRGYEYSDGLYDAIKAAKNNDILFVAAAGNESNNNDGLYPAYPASYNLDNIISVLSTDYYDDMSSFSNYGATKVDLGAPGEDILSTLPRYETPGMTANGLPTYYGTLSGTSMAAPHVSGACVLMKAIRPEFNSRKIKAVILDSVDKVLPTGLCVSDGRLNLHNALWMAVPGRVRNWTKSKWYTTIQLALDATTTTNGDIIIADANHWYIENINFKGKNVTLRSGDVDHPSDSTTSPTNTYISGLFDFDGGGDYVVRLDSGEDATTSLSGFTITDGRAGSIHIQNSSPVIVGNIITKNNGGIYCYNAPGPTIIYCQITDNSQSYSGIYCHNSSPSVFNCTISGNTTWNKGGGIYCDSSSNASIYDSTITDNTSGGNGGGIYIYNSSPTISGSQITGCDSGGQGGGIYMDGSSLAVTNCQITNCNSVWEGGGIYMYDSSSEINECQITDCNSSWDGGGIYCDSGSGPNIINSTIINNIASYDGGGIYLNGVSSLIKNCLVVDNAVESWDGGGVFCWDASPTITNCTFARNSGNKYDGAGGALYCLGISKPVVTDCIFSDNKGIAIYESSISSDAKAKWCLFYNNPDGDYFDRDTGTIVMADRTVPGNILCNMKHYDVRDANDSHNLTANPMFVHGRLGDFYLSQFAAGQILDANGVPVDPNVNPEDATSPAVDAGSGNANNPNIAMNLYSTRTDNGKDFGRVDIGYHYIDSLPAVYYNLSTAVVPVGTGSISPNPAGNPHVYVQYAQVLLTASPIDPCTYQFKSWQGTDNDARRDLGGSGQILRVQHNIVTMNSNKNVIAAFETVMVILRCRVIGGNGDINPRRGEYPRGSVVGLTAIPANPSNRVRWHGSNNDYSTLLTNTVTMSPPFIMDPRGREYKEVSIEFYEPRMLDVPGDYTNIQWAIYNANDGDIVVIAPGIYDVRNSSLPYEDPFVYISGQAITITSVNPDDPCTVAATVIYGAGFVIENVNRGTVINGLTIRSAWYGVNSIWASPTDPGEDGAGGHMGDTFGGGMRLRDTLLNYPYTPCVTSPDVRNCRFLDCAVAGTHGANGNSGEDDMGYTGQGGWPGAAYGGAVSVGQNGSPIFTNCAFIDCFARGGDGGNGADGSAIYPPGHGGGWGNPHDSYLVMWEYGPFEDYWKYTAFGGAVYCAANSFPEFVDCNFINNHAYGGSCGISGLWTGGYQLDGWPYWHYKIDGFGGAVYASTSSSPRFTGCSFIGNEADVNGLAWHAGMSDPQPALTVKDDPYISYGGAVAFEDGATITLNKCTFNDNLATVGGGIWGTRSDPDINDCNFLQNTAYHGGGVYLVGGAPEIVRSDFIENEALSDTIIVGPSNFMEVLGEGGAIHISGADATIFDCNVYNNNAGGSGGGIYISNSSKPLVKNCLITDNSARRDGGGVSVNEHSDVNIVNCTIAENMGLQYGGGVHCSYNGYVNVINSIIWNNVGINGSQLSVATSYKGDPRPSTVDVSYSDVGVQADRLEFIDANGLPTIRSGFDANSLAANDDSSTGLVDIGFELDFFGKTYSQLYVNNNGNVTFDANMWVFTPFGLTGNIGTPIIASFFADVDTRPGITDTNALTRYGRGTVDGHAAFGVTWINVGYFNTHWDKLNSFQLVIIDRSDRAPGDFDIEFNYEKIQWETGDASGGVNGFGGYSAHAGFSNGTGDPGTFYEFAGSGVPGSFLNSSPTGLIHGSRRSEVNGRYIFAVQRGLPELLHTIPIYVDANCILNGWNPSAPDPNDPWNHSTHNLRIDANPLFIAGYYLSQVAAGQPVDSPCVNSGSANANAPYLGLDTYTTRTDSVTDAGIVDMGYHYEPFTVPQYQLTFTAIKTNEPGWPVPVIIQPTPTEPNFYQSIHNWYETVNLKINPNYSNYYQVLWTGSDDDSITGPDNTIIMDGDKRITVQFVKARYDLTIAVDGGNGRLFAKWFEGKDPCEAPNTSAVKFGTLVQLTAVPDEGFRIKRWVGTNNDTSRDPNNTVTMNSNRTVHVQFEPPATITVPGDYSSIQQALDAAEDGDIILIAPGTYTTSTGYLIQNKAITISGIAPEDPCIVAATVINLGIGESGYVSTSAFTIYNVGPDAVLNGFTISGFAHRAYSGLDADKAGEDGYNGDHGFGGGIICYMASPTIKNCIIADCSVIGGNGGNGYDGTGTELADPNIHGTDGGWPGKAYGGGLACLVNSNPAVINCTFQNCSAVGGNGGNGGNGNTAEDVWGTGGRGGGWYYGEDSRWFNVPWDRSSQGYNREGPVRNSFYDFYTKYTARGGAVFIGEQCSPTFTHCTFTNNRTEGGTCGICGLDGWPPVARVEPSFHWEIENFGGAAYCETNSSPVFVDCTFTGNTAGVNYAGNNDDPYVSYGGAVAWETDANVAFENCIFNDNLACIGGAMYGEWANPLIVDCNLTANAAYHGGGVYFIGGAPEITRSDFSQNEALYDTSITDSNSPVEVLGEGGAIHCFDTDVTIIDCNIFDNDAAGSGGGIYMTGRPLVKNCLITGNIAGRDGGGISANWRSDSNIINCTIVGNRVTGSGFDIGYGGGLSCSYNSYVNIINSIVWDNLGSIGTKGSQLAIAAGFKYDPRPSTVNVTYSDIQDATDPCAFGQRMNSLDLVFCIDTTGSMSDDIAAVKAAARQITTAIATQIPDFRIAVVDYKDFNEPNYGGATDYPYRTDVGFTTDTNKVIAALNLLTASGGADTPESVYTAVMHCIDHNLLAEALGGELYGADPNSKGPGAWRHGNVMRVVILMGDAPPHDPEPFTDYTVDDIAAAAGGAEPKHIMPVLIGPDAEAGNYFRSLAAETGGTVLQAAGAEEVVGALMDAINLISLVPDPIFVDASCVLNWSHISYEWNSNSHNIDSDPCFIAGYFLSQIAAWQRVDSPCVNSGSANANAPYLGLDTYTTRIDSVEDSGIVDMGYHYQLFTVPQYELTFEAINVTEPGWPVPVIVEPVSAEPNFYKGLHNWYTTVQLKINSHNYDPNIYQVLWAGSDNDDASGPSNTVTMNGDKVVSVQFVKTKYSLTIAVNGGNGRLFAEWLENSTHYSINDPCTYSVKFGTVVWLSSKPDEGYRLKRWSGTDDDSSRDSDNTVTMDSDVTVRVEFGLPKMLSVPGDYTSIKQAIDAAENGDQIAIARGTYMTSQGYQISNKAITIRSTNPDDPCCVAATIIRVQTPGDEGWVWHAFDFANVGPSTVLNGLTITGEGFSFAPRDGNDGSSSDPNLLSGKNGESFSGGAILCDNASPTIKNCVITGWGIIAGDGGDGVNGTTGHPEGGHGGWPGRASGAGMACHNNSNPAVTNCTFSNCTVTGGNGGDGGNGNASPAGEGGRGGGWYYGYPVNWPYGPYELYTRYSGFGGAVYVGQNCTPTFTNCTFRNNRSEGGTCGICGQDNSDQGRDEPAIHLKIDNFGGAVYCDANSSPVFRYCVFNDNVADTNTLPNSKDEYVSYGGAVAFEEGAKPVFENCTFNNNQATVGGAIYWQHAESLIQDCNLVANLAYAGGGVCFFGGSGEIVQSNFIRNDVNGPAGEGGGIYCSDANVLIVDCNLSRNDADSSGGGAYISDSLASFKNCLITNNLAGRDGGGVSVDWFAEPNISNCTFVSNAALGTIGEPGKTGFGGALYCGYESDCEVIDSIFWNNLAIRGTAIAVHTGFEYAPSPSTLTISYSDVKSGQAGIQVDTGCTLNWLAGNFATDPLFVTGLLGDYYLSQTDSGQSQNSPCVNTGSDLASNLDMVVNLLDMASYTTRTDGELDRGIVDMGYHYPSSAVEACGFCNLFKKDLNGNPEGLIDFRDFAVFTLHWLDEHCSAANGWCKGTDFTTDSVVDIFDLSYFVNCWLAKDTSAPVPNPSEWKTPPYGTTSISMEAERAVDGWGWNVQYYFERVPLGVPNSGWQNSPIWQDTSVVQGIEYGYRIKTKDELGNQSEWSEIRYAGEYYDNTAPEPEPNINNIQALSMNSISMTATTVYDDSGVEYYFDTDTAGAHDSNWIDVPNYVNVNLTPGTEYRYRVKARDLSFYKNETGWSDWAYATTLEDLNAPTPNPATWKTEPYSTSLTSIFMEATTAYDDSGVEYYFECTSHPEYSSNINPNVYQDSPIYQVAGLPKGMFTFVVRVRDKSPSQNTTGNSVAITVDLLPPNPDPMAWDSQGDPNGYPRMVYYGGGWNDYWAEMRAVVATDASGDVYYQFVCEGSYSGLSSPWQLNDPTYAVKIGQKSAYTQWHVIARDQYGNITGPSPTKAAWPAPAGP